MACLKYGYGVLQLNSIIARAMKANPASVRVMEKTGMRFVKENACGGEQGVIYEITRDTFV